MREALETRPQGPQPGPDELIAALGEVTGAPMARLKGVSPGATGNPATYFKRWARETLLP